MITVSLHSIRDLVGDLDIEIMTSSQGSFGISGDLETLVRFLLDVVPDLYLQDDHNTGIPKEWRGIRAYTLGLSTVFYWPDIQAK